MHGSVLGFFVGGALCPDEVAGRDVLEVGSLDVNGSVRAIVEAMGSRSYLGVDVVGGPKVDRVLDCADLTATLGPESADIVISAEMLEHAADWQAAVRNMAEAVRPGGLLLVTTRSVGFAWHHPPDCWRYTVDAFAQIVDVLGFEAVWLTGDPEYPGVFCKARKPQAWQRPYWAGLDAVTGVTSMAKPLDILGLPHGPDGSGYYRMYLPFKHLVRSGGQNAQIPPIGSYDPGVIDPDVIDLIVSQRPCLPAEVRQWENWKGHTKLVYELDDDMWRPDPAGIPQWTDPKVAEGATACLRMADLVTVTSEPLAATVRQHNDNVVVLPDHINAELLGLERPRRERLTVGWAGGPSHLRDMVSVAAAVNRVLADRPDVDLHLVGACFDPLFTRSRWTRWSDDIWGYYKAVDFDVAIAPLADHPFNTAKSPIRCLEMAALGIPVVAEDRLPYSAFVVDGVTGFLAGSEDEWHARISELLADEGLRARMGLAARAQAAGRTIQTGWRRWLAAYESIAEAAR